MKYITFIISFLFSITAGFAAPNNVNGVVNLSSTAEGISASWMETTDEDSSPVAFYRVYIDIHAVGDEENYADVQNTTDATPSYLITSFQGQDLVNNQTYYVSVTAVNNQGEESLSYSFESSITFQSSQVTQEELHGTAEDNEVVEGVVQLLSAQADSNTSVSVVFNTDVVVPEHGFVVEATSGGFLNLVSTQVEGSTVTFTTEAQTEGEMYTVTALSSVTDLEGNPVVSGVMDSATFTGVAAVVEEVAQEEELHGTLLLDTTAPEDVTDFSSSYTWNNDLQKYDVDMDWAASENSEGDLEYHNYYQKTDKEEFGTAIRIDKEKTSYQRVLAGGERYTFKISTVDDNGNESVGAMTSIILPETGPAALLGVMTFMSAAGAYMVRRKK